MSQFLIAYKIFNFEPHKKALLEKRRVLNEWHRVLSGLSLDSNNRQWQELRVNGETKSFVVVIQDQSHIYQGKLSLNWLNSLVGHPDT